MEMHKQLHSGCARVLKTLMSKKAALWFLTPVDPIKHGAPDYFKYIKHPMDLGTVKTKLGKRSGDSQYSGFAPFEGDIKLVFQNAMQYNIAQKGDPQSVYSAAARMLKTAEKELKKVKERENKLKEKKAASRASGTASAGIGATDKKKKKKSKKKKAAPAPMIIDDDDGTGLTPPQKAEALKYLEQLRLGDSGEIFMHPVDTATFADYLHCVKTPMDLGTITQVRPPARPLTGGRLGGPA